MSVRKIGRYEIVEEIGRGAMGVVYKALDPVLGRTVAIKTISMSHDPEESAENEARFYQEAKAAGGLAHPNIVVVYDIGNAANTNYMAMEFLEGKEVGALWGSGNPAPADSAVDVAMQVAAGLAYAHERGVVHRDIKPANIMVLADGRVKITDFGIAKIRTPEVKTQTGKLLGSPRYMPPEVFLGKRADHRSDVFSLGVILYELLTGTPPFVGESVSALMYQTINLTPSPPSTVRPGLPGMLDFIVAKMLAKEPDERYQSARELAADLREALREMRQSAARESGSKRGGTSEAAAREQDMLDSTVPLVRTGTDLEPQAVPAPTLGISRAFDSLAATHRLAAMTGVEPARDVTTTVNLDQLALSRMATAAPSSGASAAPRWSRLDAAIFAAGTAIAAVIAVVIAIV
jgi:serine/threonine-protein kinase